MANYLTIYCVFITFPNLAGSHSSMIESMSFFMISKCFWNFKNIKAGHHSLFSFFLQYSYFGYLFRAPLCMLLLEQSKVCFSIISNLQKSIKLCGVILLRIILECNSSEWHGAQKRRWFSVKERRVSHFNLKMFSAISFPIANSVDKNWTLDLCIMRHLFHHCATTTNYTQRWAIHYLSFPEISWNE